MAQSPRPSTPGSSSNMGEASASVDSSGGSQTSASTRDARAQPRTVLSDRYHLGEELGRGAFGLVFKGQDTRTGAAVAIKQLSLAGISAETLQSIMGEIELLKNLNHKNIVKYIGSFKTRTHLYIILEYMDRGAISSVIKPSQFGAFPESLVAVYIAQVLQGLAYLHDQGVVHRDIKGANILTTSEGLVKLADFGVAARLSELEADRDKSRISVVGTPYWMAPEVIEMTSTTPASDIWSVACLSIELLTGQPPYFDLQPMSALFRIVQDEKPELPTKMSGDMHDFLHQCFQKDPQKRPTARDLLKHKWITYNRRTLRSSWNRTQGAKNMGKRTDAHKSVSTVVEQILQAEADEFAASAAAAAAGKPLPTQAELSSRTPPQIPMNQSRGSTLTESRSSSREFAGSRGPSLEKAGTNTGEVPAQAPLPSSGEPLPYTSPQIGTQVQENVAVERTSNGAEPRVEVAFEGDKDYPTHDGAGYESQGLLEGLLQDQPARREAGEDLMLWLELREQNQLGSSEEALPTSEEMVEIVDGMVNSHQQAAEVRRLVAIWRQGYGRKTGALGQPQSSDRAAKSIEAGQALMAMCCDNPGRVETFLAEDGGVALVELLQEPCSERVAVHALQFLNELVTLSVKALGSSALLGVVLAVAKYAVNGGPLGAPPSQDARLQAAYFLQYLAGTNLLTAQLLLTCQGLPVVLGLIEPEFEEYGPLVHIGVHSIWRILELHGIVSMNQICRLLSGAGLAQRLVYALGSAIAFSRDVKKQSRSKQGRVGSKGVQSGGALEQQWGGVETPESQSSGRIGAQDPSSGGLRSLPSKASPLSRSYNSLDPSEGLPTLLDKMANLLLVMSHADTAVKARLCETETLRTLFTAIEISPEALQLTVLKAVKQLTSDPSMLEALEGAGTIGSLGKYLRAAMPLPIQVEALHALHNLCKISRQRQEAAASAGLVPYLMNLAQMSPKQVEAEPLQEQLRQMAISLLCGMVHSTWSTRMALWNCNGLHTLLELLKEEDWQGPALEALASWLHEDMNRIEGRLSQQQSIARFVQLFNTYSTRGGSNALARLLDPFLKILKKSPQITIEVAIAGLAGIVVEMLKTASALTALSLLQMVRVIYEHHPRPKEFVAKYNITDQLRELSKARGSQASVLVNKQATHLLHAFQINSIF